MAVTEMFWGTTLTSFNLWNNVSSGLRPWTTWADVHSNFESVHAFPMLFIPEKYVRVMMLFWWSIPASSIIFFAFFGFGAETVKEYRRIWSSFKTTVFRKRDSEKTDSLFGKSMSKKLVNFPLKFVEQHNNDVHLSQLAVVRYDPFDFPT